MSHWAFFVMYHERRVSYHPYSLPLPLTKPLSLCNLFLYMFVPYCATLMRRILFNLLLATTIP